MVRIVVACGGSIFTTTIVGDEIKEILKKERIPCVITPAKITEIAGMADTDLIVVTGKYGTNIHNVYNTPIMVGMPLLIGVGKEQFTEELVAKIKEIEAAKK